MDSALPTNVAFITGLTGQDGSYLSELLLSKGYTVHGLVRGSSSFNTARLEHLYTDPSLSGRFFLHYGDLSDSSNLVNLLAAIQPSEIYHLAAQPHVDVSFHMPEHTCEINAIGTLRLLNAIRTCGLEKHCKFFHASTSQLYSGKGAEPEHQHHTATAATAKQDIHTAFYPRSPYAVAELYAYNIVVNYRESYSMFAVNGILFNHESPRRGETFVTRKITRAVARIFLGLQDVLYLGNLDSYRDWGHAEDYVEAMWRILNCQSIQSPLEITNRNMPKDYVVSMQETHTVREFVEMAFQYVGMQIEWHGEGVDEVGLNASNPAQVLVRIDPQYYRASQVDFLCGVSREARSELGWKPKHTFETLVQRMVEEDMKSIKHANALRLTCTVSPPDAVEAKSQQQAPQLKTVDLLDAEQERPQLGATQYGSICALPLKSSTTAPKYRYKGADTNKGDGKLAVCFESAIVAAAATAKAPTSPSDNSRYRKLRHINVHISRVPSLTAARERAVALVTGVTGQDGSYLAERLLKLGYEVYGIVRRSSSFNTARIQRIYSDTHIKHPHFHLHYGDLCDTASLTHLIASMQPNEIYNLAAQSHVKVSFQMSEYTADIDALGVLRLLDAVRICGLTKQTKFYQASTSELYGGVYKYATNEDVPFCPRSPYAVAKLYSYWIVKCYRETYGMFAVNGILFNHESPRRGETFVTRKITRAVARIFLGLQDVLYLGNLDSYRDWGHAEDYVEAMWRILNCQSIQSPLEITNRNMPKDYVVSMQETHTVREFVEMAFQYVGMQIEWHGKGDSEYGTAVYDGSSNVNVVVRVNPEFYRPSEVEHLWGDSSRARNELAWKPSHSFQQLLAEMMDHDLLEAARDLRAAATSLESWICTAAAASSSNFAVTPALDGLQQLKKRHAHNLPINSPLPNDVPI